MARNTISQVNKVTCEGTSALVTALEQGYRRLEAPDQKLLLAVSGGADSTALLIGTQLIRDRLRLWIEVATVDHGLRPDGSQECERVAALARRFELPCHRLALSLSTGPGIEERARSARYEALESVRATRHLALIVTAHTASDQAETLLMRLARGAGLKGARAIHSSRGRVIRPLLGCTRDEVERFIAEQAVEVTCDPMNFDAAFLRVRMRLSALPALEAAAGPGAARNLARFAQLAVEDEDLLGTLAQDAFAKARLHDSALDAVAVRVLPLALRRRVLVLFIEQLGLPADFELVEKARQVVALGGTATLPRDRLLKCERGVLYCEPSAPRSA